MSLLVALQAPPCAIFHCLWEHQHCIRHGWSCQNACHNASMDLYHSWRPKSIENHVASDSETYGFFLGPSSKAPCLLTPMVGPVDWLSLEDIGGFSSSCVVEWSTGRTLFIPCRDPNREQGRSSLLGIKSATAKFDLLLEWRRAIKKWEQYKISIERMLARIVPFPYSC